MSWRCRSLVLALVAALGSISAPRPAAAQNATGIRAGQTVQGELTSADTKLTDGSYADYYTFDGRAGEQVRVTMRSRGFDTYLVLGRLSGGRFSSLQSDDDGGGGTDSQVTYTLPDDGTFAIRANTLAPAKTGSYTLGLESLGLAAGSGGGNGNTAMSGGQTIQGELTTDDTKLDDGSYADYYTYQGHAGEQIRATMRSRVFDTYLVIGRLDGKRFSALQSNDDGGGGTDSQITYTLPGDGTYAFRANTLSAGKTGSYTLTIEPVSSAPAGTGARANTATTVSDAAPILAGQTIQGELSSTDVRLDDNSYADYFAFDGRAGQRVRVTLRSRAFDSYLVFGRLVGTRFSSLQSNDDGGGGNDSQITYTLPDDGTYAIRVNTLAARQTGAYTVGLELLGAGSSANDAPGSSVSGTSISRGQVLRGALDGSDFTLSDGSYAEDFVYHGRSGERITVTLRSSAFDAYLKFGQMNGQSFHELAADDDSAGGTDSQLSFTLPSTGDYVIRANTLFKDKTGSFTVSVEP